MSLVDSSADLLPPDKADESRILQAGFRLLEVLAGRMGGARPEVTLQLGAAEWAALEAETRRIYRPHAAYKYTPHPEGIGAVRWVRRAAPAVATDPLCKECGGIDCDSQECSA